MIFRGLDLIEPIAVPDDYVEGIGRIEDAGGGNLRVYFYARQRSLHGGSVENIVIRRMIVPAVNIEAACRLCLAAAEGTIKVNPDDVMRHLN